MKSRRQRAPGLARGLAALVLALFAVGWLCDRAHVAYESHGYCAEHQRVEHASPAAHAHDGDHDHDGPVVDARDEATDAHAACCVLLGRGEDPLALPESVACVHDVPRVAEHALPRVDSERAHDAVPRLALAPKQSPPVL